MDKLNFCKQWKYYKQEQSNKIADINLPHDAMIAEKRDPNSPGGSANAFFTGGVYVYEKTFFAPSEWAEKCVTFHFEGAYKNSKVYINDNEAGGCAYGYIPFFVNADSYLNYGSENTIRVVADNKDLPNSRWYTGGGIYRPVWLLVSNKVHIEIEGVKISTISYSPAKIRIQTAHTGGKITLQILDKGKVIAEGNGDSVELVIPNAKLWSDEEPYLYQCRATLTDNGAVMDETVETFGIRKVEWSTKGLSINGKKTLLRGGCVHHDNGILGARSYAESEERRVRIMKEAGFNAIRSSHNPASKAMLAACDKYGMYMIDETWDMWYNHKSKYDYATDFKNYFKADINALINRNFNHPSVIMYSIGNEVAEPYQQKGVELIREMVDYIHSLDKNRAVTAGINLFLIHRASKGQGIYKEEGGMANEDKRSKKQKASGSLFFNILASKMGASMNKMANSQAADNVTSPCLDALDIAGYNYASGRYPLEGKSHPNRVIFGAETFSQDIYKNWDMVKQYPYLIGDFMWTAWDYIGEVGMGAWAYTDDAQSFNKPYPWLLAGSGAIDILGHIGAVAEYAAIVWGLRNTPYIGVRPINHPGKKLTKAVWRGANAINSWAWKGCNGSKAIVEVYANGAVAELLLNGKTIGKKKIKECKAIFNTKYTPGKLSAVIRNSFGKEISRNELISAKGKISICVQPEAKTIEQGEIVYFNISLTGENGVVEHNADSKLAVTVEGGTLLAFGSANPRTEESYHTGSFTTYYGRAQAVVYADGAGKIKLNVTGNGLTPAKAEINVNAARR